MELQNINFGIAIYYRDFSCFVWYFKIRFAKLLCKAVKKPTRVFTIKVFILNDQF